MSQLFKWKRFWCSRSGYISLDDNGFMMDPEHRYSAFYNKDVGPFEEIQKFPCLILLGEPGSGKTTALHSEYEIYLQQNDNSSDKYFYKNLNEYGDEQRLIGEIFKSNEIIDWLENQYHLHLFLDSFDECLVEIPKLTAIFRKQFDRLKKHAKRLNLRICSRTGDWPETLTELFHSIWEKENVSVYELTPLRKKDVSEAAHSYGLDPSSFIKAIIEKEIQPLAINPLTLNLLLNEFKNNQKLPDSRKELFLRGCEHFCAEHNPDRRTGALTPKRRIVLASRIAAVMVFCKRSSIRTKATAFNENNTELTLSMLQEGQETTGSDHFHFNENDLRETITQTALFSSRGPYRFGFAHQSYAEFLAAYYLKLHSLSIEQIMSLIHLSDDPEQMVIPQLRETTAWLMSFAPELAKKKIQTDPQSLLYGGVEILESRYRKDLVDSLLKLFDEKKINSDWGLNSQYKHLKHPEIASQLKPFIEDTKKQVFVRRVAIDIAEKCEITELQDLLADIALKKSEHIRIRSQAAHAVGKIGDDNTCLRLKPLALEPQTEDKNDQLKGYALRMLWPKQIAIQELFGSLTPSKEHSFFGSYAMFLMHYFPDDLGIDDLPIALEWVKKNPGYIAIEQYHDLAEKILFKAWQHLDRPEILEAYAEAVIPRMENYLSIRPTSRAEIDEQEAPDLSDKTRKDLVRAVVRKGKSYQKNELFIYRMIDNRILFIEDLSWLIKELKAENDQDIKTIWVEILHVLCTSSYKTCADNLELIMQAMSECQMLAAKFRSLFEPIPLDSPQAQKMHSNYEEYLALEKERQELEYEQNKKISPPVNERINECLNRFESGDSNVSENDT